MNTAKGHAVIIAPAARNDLTEIAAYIALDSPERSNRFVDELERKCLELGTRPMTWPALADLRGGGLRRRLHAGYLIFYRISEDKVEIVRIIHSARNYPALLFDE